MSLSSVVKRHSDTHFANIPYGYYVLSVVVFYMVFLILMRKLIPSRYTKVSPWKNRLLQSIRTASPLFHMPVLLVLVFVPFVHHYSVSEHISIYIKRLARLSYVLVVLNVILTLRPRSILLGYSYLDLIGLHKWLSRFVVVLGLLHGVGFVIKWALDPTVSTMTKILKFYNLVGVVASVPMLILILVSIRPWRRHNYSLFYIVHQLGQWSMVFLIPIHARPRVTVPYFMILFIIYVWKLISLNHDMRTVTVSQRVKEPDTSLTYAKFDGSVLKDWIPGSHVRLSKYSRTNILFWLMPTHPFTIASLPDENQVDLIIRENANPYVAVGDYTVAGVYNTVPSSLLFDSQRVSIVVGGSGISFGLGIFKYLQTRNLDYLKFIWLVREKADLHVLNHCNVDVNDLEVYVTRSLAKDDTQTKTSNSSNESGFDDVDFELETMDDSGALLSNDVKVPSLVHFGKRLDWQVDLAHFIEPHALQNTWLVCCGPESLLTDGQSYAQNNNCNFLKEFYDL